MITTFKKIITDIPHKQYDFSILDNQYIAIFSDYWTFLYSINGEYLARLDYYYNGEVDSLILLPNGMLFDGINIYNIKGQLQNLKFKLPKKSCTLTTMPINDKLRNELIIGYSNGFIGVYDYNLKPIRFIPIDRKDKLEKIDFIKQKVYIFNWETFVLKILSYPEFTIEKEYQLGKRNSELLIGDNFIFNYGYTSTNYILNQSTDEISKIQLHKTKQKGYKEQYNGPQNFGTYGVYPNERGDRLLAHTHQDEYFLVDLEAKKGVKLNFDSISNDIVNPKYREQQSNIYEGEVIVSNAFQERAFNLHSYDSIDRQFYTNFNGHLMTWDLDGNPTLLEDVPIELHIKHKISYFLKDNNLYQRVLTF